MPVEQPTEDPLIIIREAAKAGCNEPCQFVIPSKKFRPGWSVKLMDGTRLWGRGGSLYAARKRPESALGWAVKSPGPAGSYWQPWLPRGVAPTDLPGARAKSNPKSGNDHPHKPKLNPNDQAEPD